MSKLLWSFIGVVIVLIALVLFSTIDSERPVKKIEKPVSLNAQ
jgi:hypothetical protein